MFVANGARVVIHEWNFEAQKKTIQLIRSPQDQLICRVFDRAHGQNRERIIQKPQTMSADQYGAQIAQTMAPEIAYNREGPTCAATFTNSSFTIIHKWLAAANGGVEVRLLRSPSNELVWTAIDTTTNKMGIWREQGAVTQRLHLWVHGEISEVVYNGDGEPCSVKFDEPVQVWISNNKKIQLRQKENRLLLEILDLPQGNCLWRQDQFELQGLDIEQTKVFLRTQCEPEVTTNIFGVSGIRLSAPLPVCHQWVIDGKVIHIVRKNDTLMCRVCDPVTNVNSLFEITGLADFQSVDERITFLQGLKPKITLGETGLPVKVELQNIASYLSPEKVINLNRWAVTLVCCGNCASSNPISWGGHAAIIVEGVNEKGYFMKRIHLVARKNENQTYISGHVSFQEITELFFTGTTLRYRKNNRDGTVEEDKLYNSKAESWIVDCNSVKRMFGIVQNQHEDPLPCIFNPLGSESALVQDKFFVNGRGIMENSSFNTFFAKAFAVFTDISYVLAIARKPEKAFETRRHHVTTHGILEGSSATSAVSEKIQSDWRDQLVQTYGRENVRVIPSENCITYAKKTLKILGIDVSENVFSEIFSQAYGRLITIPKSFTS